MLTGVTGDKGTHCTGITCLYSLLTTSKYFMMVAVRRDPGTYPSTSKSAALLFYVGEITAIKPQECRCMLWPVQCSVV